MNLKTNNLAIIDFGSGCHANQDPLREFEGWPQTKKWSKADVQAPTSMLPLSGWGPGSTKESLPLSGALVGIIFIFVFLYFSVKLIDSSGILLHVMLAGDVPYQTNEDICRGDTTTFRFLWKKNNKKKGGHNHL